MVEISPLSREAMVNQIHGYLNTGRVAEARQAIEVMSQLHVKEDPLSAAWLAILDRNPNALQAVVDRNVDVDNWTFPFHRIWNVAISERRLILRTRRRLRGERRNRFSEIETISQLLINSSR